MDRGSWARGHLERPWNASKAVRFRIESIQPAQKILRTVEVVLQVGDLEVQVGFPLLCDQGRSACKRRGRPQVATHGVLGTIVEGTTLKPVLRWSSEGLLLACTLAAHVATFAFALVLASEALGSGPRQGE